MNKKKLQAYEAETDFYCNDFEDTFDFYKEGVVIGGNRDFNTFNNITEIQWIDEGDNPDECGWYSIDKTFACFNRDRAIYHILNSLKRATGKEWDYMVIKGYSQSEWQYLWYMKEIYSEQELSSLGDLYMGTYKTFVIKNKNNEVEMVETITDTEYYDSKNKSYSQILTDRIGKPIQVNIIAGYHTEPEWKAE